MTVRRNTERRVSLEGVCPVEDAEPLLQLLQATPEAVCDWTGCSHLHTAVVQVIMVARPVLAGPCGDPWVEAWLAQQLSAKS